MIDAHLYVEFKAFLKSEHVLQNGLVRDCFWLCLRTNVKYMCLLRIIFTLWQSKFFSHCINKRKALSTSNIAM